MTTDLHAISEKLSLAVRRLQTFDRSAHAEAYQDIVEAAFWLALLMDSSEPVNESIGRALEEGKP